MTLKLSLLRHAKSSRDNPDLDDFDRPLASRGLRDAPEMGKRLAARGVRPDLIVTSSARRALQTARLVSHEIGVPSRKLRHDDRIYMASVPALVSIIRGLDDALTHVMLVGHNPGFTDLVERISDGDIDNVPTCGYVEIEFDHARWKDAGKGSGRLVHFNFPKNSRGSR
ncbi:MAG TPA: histidine phosphatase family protein [Gammaproteobacteria bacterium]|nr:histidine phosphatase family protein [Gammaproteobacteria bacterium]